MFFNNDFLGKEGRKEIVIQDEGWRSEESTWVLINVIQLKIVNYFHCQEIIFHVINLKMKTAKLGLL